MTNDDDVARMTRPEREARVTVLQASALRLLDDAITEHITADGRALAGVVVLFSGGNDSTVLAHLFRHRATYAAHANTTIGIEDTRQFVRDTCADWGLPLLERTPPRRTDHYRALVLEHGFPGPGHHFKMFQRLKERGLNQIRGELVTKPYRQRVVFLAGRRRSESQRRQAIPDVERNRSTVWVSPLADWTALDLNTYRLMHGDVPRNRVADLLHMSGECLCGSFAKPDERAELALWFPDVVAQIADLEAAIADRDDIPAHRKIWGWGADADTLRAHRRHKVGALCTSCEGDAP